MSPLVARAAFLSGGSGVCRSARRNPFKSKDGLSSTITTKGFGRRLSAKLASPPVHNEELAPRAHRKEGRRPFRHRAELPERRLHPGELLPALCHLCGYRSRGLLLPCRGHLPHAGRMPLPNLQGVLRVDIAAKLSFWPAIIRPPRSLPSSGLIPRRGMPVVLFLGVLRLAFGQFP